MALSPSAENRYERRRRRSRQALLEAAIALFQEQGIRATKLEEVCARADVAPRTFFNHFETREHLYRSIAQQRVEQLADALDASATDPRPFAERLLELFAEIGRHLSERPAYRELVSEMLHLRIESDDPISREGDLGRAVGRLVADAIRRGEVGRRHAPEVLADLLLGATTTALTNWCADAAYDLVAGLERSARALLELCDPDRDTPRPSPSHGGAP